MRIVAILAVLLTVSVGGMGDISITIIKPTENGFSGDPLTVVATVQSTFELRTIAARVEDREAELVFSQEAYFDYRMTEWRPGWTGQVPLSGLAKGSQRVSVTAQDVFGSSGSKEVGFIFNEKPIVTVEEPLSDSVAVPIIKVRVSSSDDDEADSRIEIWATDSHGSKLGLVLSGGELIDEEVDLSNFDHSSIRLRFNGIDSAGQVSSDERVVWVESNPRLVHLQSVEGRIFDVQGDRILYLEGDNLKIRDTVSGEESVIVTELRPSYGFLTPKGAIFVGGDDVITWRVFDFRDSSLVDLGPCWSSTLKVRGDYAVWSDRSSLVLRDLVSGTNTIVAETGWPTPGDVSAGGVVVYSSYPDSQVFRYEKGSTLQLTHDKDFWNGGALTDGTNVIYYKSRPYASVEDQTYVIAMHGPQGEAILAGPWTPRVIPSFFYAANNGWLAFPRPGTGGELQVWTRSPSGELEQRSFFGTSSYVECLNPYGEVVFRNDQTRCLSVPGQSFLSLGRLARYPTLRPMFWQDGQWLLVIGRSLFSVDTTPASIRAVNPAMKSGGEFGLQVEAVNLRKVTIQVSSDLSTWEDVVTEWVRDGVASFVDADAGSFLGRFYRAKGLTE